MGISCFFKNITFSLYNPFILHLDIDFYEFTTRENMQQQNLLLDAFL